MNAPAYRIADDNVIHFRGRAVLVVQDQDGQRQAFYRSTGRGGNSSAGEWIPVYGFDFAPECGGVWFVKIEGDRKRAETGSTLAEMATWLMELDAQGDLPPNKDERHPHWMANLTMRERLDLVDDLLVANDYLRFMRAAERPGHKRFDAADHKRIRQEISSAFGR